MKLIIGNKNSSSWSLRAWLLLTANNISFEEVRVVLDTPTTHKELLQYSDTALVPVLHDGDLIIWDSLAICEYISENYLQGRGWPEDIAKRAIARSAVAEMHSRFSALRKQMPMNCRASNREVDRTNALSDDINRIDQLWSKLRNRHDLDGPWLMGQFSIADCMFAPVAFRFQTYQVKLSPTAQHYANSIINHPSMQQWLQQAKHEPEILHRQETG